MFEEFGALGNAMILFASFFALNKASNWVITNSVKVADITGFAKTTVGFILVAFSTSLPELCVSIFAAIGQESIGVAVGNVLGSNIVNICLILGICFILVALKTSKHTYIRPDMARDDVGSLYFGLFIASVIPLALLYIGYASQLIGVILLVIFVFYIYQLSRIRKVKEPDSSGGKNEKLGIYVILTLLGGIGVIISSYFIVGSATYLAKEVLDIPPVVIGATIVAFGTSLPELATSVDSVRKGHLDLALGNIVGSCFINITCILGVTLAASTLRVDMTAFSNLVMFSLMTNLFFWYFLSSGRISWREGAVLLFIYFIFLAISFGGIRS